jgi:YcfA-like protein.
MVANETAGICHQAPHREGYQPRGATAGVEKKGLSFRRRPAGLSFDEFKTLLSRYGWVFDHQSGSHEIWYSPGRRRLPIQPAGNGKAKVYQVRQFLKLFDEEAGDGGPV